MRVALLPVLLTVACATAPVPPPAPAPSPSVMPRRLPREPVVAPPPVDPAPVEPEPAPVVEEVKPVSQEPWVPPPAKPLDPKCPGEGKPAPPFALLMSDGSEGVSLRAALARKKPIVLDFWAHWCGPCKAELPMLQRLATEFGDRATFLLVHVGPDEARMKAKLAELGVTIRSASDDTSVRQQKYCANELPLTVVIDAQGIVRARYNDLPLADYERGIRYALGSLGVK